MTYTKKGIIGNVLSLVAGVSITLLIIGLFQISSPHVFPPLEGHDSKAFYDLSEKFQPTQIKNEILGLAIGIFVGALITSFLGKNVRNVYVLLLPILVLLIISVALWPFIINKELIWLALPIWSTIALTAFYFTITIKNKFRKEKTT